MIPVVQTKMVVKNSKGEIIVRGNCLAACIASLLELPITEVPNIETLFDVGHHTYYYEVLCAFLLCRGYEFGTDDRFKVFHGTAFDVDNFLELQDKHYLVTGKTVRGTYHVCVYQNGKLVHDPHPSKEGLLTEEYFESLTKL